MDSINNKTIIVEYYLVYTDGNNYYNDTIPTYIPEIIASWLNKSKEFVVDSTHDLLRAKFEIEITSHSSFQDIINLIIHHYGVNATEVLACSGLFHVMVQKELCEIEDYDMNLEQFLDLYPPSDKLMVFFIFSKYQGVIFKEQGYKYYMHSNENGHNSPHVHVNYRHEYDVSIDISNGRVLAGYMPQHILRKAVKKIKENKDYLLDCWNKYTNGIKVNMDIGVMGEGTMYI